MFVVAEAGAAWEVPSVLMGAGLGEGKVAEEVNSEKGEVYTDNDAPKRRVNLKQCELCKQR